MKNILLASLIFSAFSAFAAPISEEAQTVNRILMNNPSVVTKLSKANIKALTEMKVKTIRPGVTKYVLNYGRDCFCIPAGAVVTILEDLTPTYSDGAPKYEAKVVISDAQ